MITHKGQHATAATEGRTRTKGRSRLEQQMAAGAVGDLAATSA